MTSSQQADYSFSDFELAPELYPALEGLGYEQATPIQALAIPAMLAGEDVVALASTGTGKTAAFALPVLTQLAQESAESSQDGHGRAPKAIILTPTRELALQVCEAFEAYATNLPQLTLLPVYGGQGYGNQLQALRRGVDVIVGTPGRIIDHMTSGRLDLSAIEHVVLDEADEMLTMGFEEEVDQILAQTPEGKQVALFSATMPPRIRKLAQKHLNEPLELTTKTAATAPSQITQRYLVVQHSLKVEALTRVLEVIRADGVIVFARTKNQTEVLAEKLRARGYAAAALNGDVPQIQRERTVDQFKSGQLDILVATDVAARGLDVERVSHVINADIPGDIQSYTHRIGRTGRAGRHGEAITFLTPRERYFVNQIRKVAGVEPEQMPMPTVDAINASRLSRFDDAITQALTQQSRIDEFRAIIDHYVRHHNVPEADVAAALAVVGQGDEPMLMDERHELKGLHAGERIRADGSERGRPERVRPERNRHDDGRPWSRYRIEVGHRHQVSPRHIVGALANEGGLASSDFGQIEIHQTFSLVELRNELSEDQRSRLAQTRISGRLIDIQADQGRPSARLRREASRSERPYSSERGGGRPGRSSARGEGRPSRGYGAGRPSGGFGRDRDRDRGKDRDGRTGRDRGYSRGFDERRGYDKPDYGKPRFDRNASDFAEGHGRRRHEDERGSYRRDEDRSQRRSGDEYYVKPKKNKGKRDEFGKKIRTNKKRKSK